LRYSRWWSLAVLISSLSPGRAQEDETIAIELLKAALECSAPSYTMNDKPLTSTLDRYQYIGTATYFKLRIRRRSITNNGDGTVIVEEVVLELGAGLSEIAKVTGYDIGFWQPSEGKGAYDGPATIALRCNDKFTCFRGTRAQSGELQSLQVSDIQINLCHLNTANNFQAAINQLQSSMNRSR
jgi:hypothetical protein